MTIAPNSTDTYTIIYDFKETGLNQNIDQGKVFSTKIKIVPGKVS